MRPRRPGDTGRPRRNGTFAKWNICQPTTAARHEMRSYGFKFEHVEDPDAVYVLGQQVCAQSLGTLHGTVPMVGGRKQTPNMKKSIMW